MNDSEEKSAPGLPLFSRLDNTDARESISASNSFYEYAIEMAADEVFLMDEDSKILYVNQSACRKLGYSREELVGKYVWEWDPLFKKEIWPSWWETFLKQKHMQFETQHYTSSGEVFPVEIKAHLYEFKGKFYSLAFVNDLTETKKIEQTIEDKSKELVNVSSRAQHYQNALLELSAQKITSLESIFQKICETSSVVMGIARVSIWLMDEHKSCIECKNLYDTKSGHSQGGVLSRKDFPGYFKALDQGNQLAIDDAESHEATMEFAESYLKPNGIVSMLDIPLFYDTKVIGVVCHEHLGEIRHWQSYETDFASTIGSFVSLAIEINKRKDIEKNLESIVVQRTKQAVDADEAKSQFLANMSHELRTPMHSILSFTNLALKRVDDEKISKYLCNIQVSATRLTELLNDLLDLAKLESGNEELHLKKHALNELLKASINEVEGLLHDKNINIEQQVQVDQSIEIDFKLMLHVIINLLSNAIKFSPAHSTIKIIANQDDSQPTNLYLSVIDQGQGIPDDQLESIFDKFVQSTMNKTQKSGTGLGLPIAKEIIELHNGRIWAESPPTNSQANQAQGTSINIKIPVSQDVIESDLKDHRINWNESYSVGDEALDEQHKKIIALINQLCDVPKNMTDNNRKFYQSIINELYLYINEHLIFEENFLRKNNYPELESHSQLHDNFRSRIDEFSDAINNNEQDVYMRIFLYLRHWFDHHILEEDMKYRRFFDSRKEII